MSQVSIRNRANGGVVKTDPALAESLVSRGGWVKVGKPAPTPKPEPEPEVVPEDDFEVDDDE